MPKSPMPLRLAQEAHEEISRRSIAWALRKKTLGPFKEINCPPEDFYPGICRKAAEIFHAAGNGEIPLDALTLADQNFAVDVLGLESNMPDILGSPGFSPLSYIRPGFRLTLPAPIIKTKTWPWPGH